MSPTVEAAPAAPGKKTNADILSLYGAGGSGGASQFGSMANQNQGFTGQNFAAQNFGAISGGFGQQPPMGQQVAAQPTMGQPQMGQSQMGMQQNNMFGMMGAQPTQTPNQAAFQAANPFMNNMFQQQQQRPSNGGGLFDLGSLQQPQQQQIPAQNNFMQQMGQVRNYYL